MTKAAKKQEPQTPAAYADLPFPDGAPGFRLYGKSKDPKRKFFIFGGTILYLDLSNHWTPDQRAIVSAVATLHFQDLFVAADPRHWSKEDYDLSAWIAARKEALAELSRAKRAAKKGGGAK